MMPPIAYGEANFENLRSKKFFYMDKTHFLPIMENKLKFFFIRPRRFGKSLWISVLHSYYDINQADKFDKLFDGLYIQKHPTEYKNSYLVLKFDFSGMNTNSKAELQREFDQRIRIEIERFVYVYQKLFSDFDIDGFLLKIQELHASDIMRLIQLIVQKNNFKVYVLIDEYDHFANKLASLSKETFVKDIISDTGFVREFYEQMKTASGEGIFERFFITGVSPIMLDELSSGFNIMDNLTTYPAFNEMLGFTEEEVRGMLDLLPDSHYTYKTKNEVFKDLLHYYDGYRFAEDAEKTVFNSDMVLYFFQYFSEYAKYPKEILDLNVKTDYGKLRGLIVGSSGKEQLKEIVEELNINKELNFPLVRRFTFENRLKPFEVKSLLYFFGLLTMSDRPNHFIIPNYVIQQLHWEYLQKFLEETGVDFDTNLLSKTITDMAERGEVETFKELAIDFFHTKLAGMDFNQLTEKHVKFFFISYFTLSNLYNVISERELPGKKHIDLLFEAHPAYYNYVKYNFIVELKYIRKSDSKKEAEKIRNQAIAQADEYYDIYLKDFNQFGRELRSMALIVYHTKKVELILRKGFGNASQMNNE
jgi:hypothetical protein